MEHQITAIDILHDKEQMISRLKARVKAGQKRGLPLQCQNLTLVQSALDIIFLHNEVFLQTLDGVYILGGFVLCQKHLIR